MKPTFQTSRPVRSRESQRPSGHSIKTAPVTDWSFQPTAADLHGGAASFQHPSAANGFRALSEEFFAAESKRSYRVEAAVFALIATSAAWPIVLAAQAALALLK